MKLTIPTEDIKGHLERIVARHGLELVTESLEHSPSPFVARHVVRRADTPGTNSDGLVIGVAFREGESDEALVEIWKNFVGRGIV